MRLTNIFWILVAVCSIGAVTKIVPAHLSDNEYIAHEWGTFTSLQASNGIDQIGMHHGDEELPRFVHCPLGFNYGRCLSLLKPDENSPLATTQRMETPVIYFYSNVKRVVDVEVRFPNGVITEWFPKASQYFPKEGQVTELKNGLMRWKASLSQESVELPEAPPENIWHAQRQVDSNFLTASGQNEKFIFYRGIGKFKVPFHVTSLETGELKLQNRSSNSVPSVILLNFEEDKGDFKDLGPLASNQVLTLLPKDIPQANQGDPASTYIHKISECLHNKLVESGLYPKEAQAMVNTWKRSYFLTPGLRALYILPRAWTDTIVPLVLNPAPKDLVRTFLGRTEIFTAKEESEWTREIRASIQNGIPYYEFPFHKMGRFAEPKLWRLKGLTANDVERDYIKQMIEQSSFIP